MKWRRTRDSALTAARLTRNLRRVIDAEVYTDCDALGAEFDTAVLVSPGVSPYCTATDWVASAAQCLHPGHAPVILRRDESWIALSLGNHDQIGPYLQPLEADWGFASPLIGPDPRHAIQLLTETLAATGGRWNVALLSGLPRQTAEDCAVALEERYRVVIRKGIRCQVADLSDGVRGFLSRRSARYRHNLRRDRRRMEREGLTLDLVPHDADVTEVMTRVLSVEQRSWKHAAGQSVLLSSRYRAFYHAVLRRAANRDQLWAMFIRKNEQDVAYVFGAVIDRTYRGFQLGYDDTHARLGLGNQVQLGLMEALADRGVTAYDLGMEMQYKDRWSDDLLDLHTLVVVADG